MSISKVVACAISLFALAGAASGQTITLNDGPGGNSGGEFNARLNGAAFTPVANFTLQGSMPGGSGGGLFATFCIETNEYISFGPTYNVAFNTGAVAGGAGGQTSPNFDPLDSQSAYLYARFANGTLTGYDYTGSGIGRASSGSALQAALWYLENEIPNLNNQTLASGGSFSLSTAERNLANSFLALAAPFANSGPLYGVQVMNLTDGAGRHQDLLVASPFQVPQSVPVPSAALAGLSCFGTLGCLSMSRRRRSAAK